MILFAVALVAGLFLVTLRRRVRTGRFSALPILGFICLLGVASVTSDTAEAGPGIQQGYVQSSSNTFTFQPGGTAAPNRYTTWGATFAAASRLGYLAPTIAVDGSLGTPTVPAGTYVLPAGLTIRSLYTNSNFTLNVANGAHFVVTDNVRFDDIVINNQNTTSPCVAVTSTISVIVENLAALQSDPVATKALFSFTGTASFSEFLVSTQSALIGSSSAPIITSALTGGATVTVFAIGESSVFANSLFGTGAIGVSLTDVSSVVQYPQTGAGALTVSGGIQKGIGSFSSGALALSGLNLSASSVFSVDVGSPAPGAGNLTVRYGVLQSSRANGAGSGAATISALNAAGTVNTLDTSTNVRWSIVGT